MNKKLKGQANPSPSLIRNKPSDVDEFAGGAHNRIAESVCSLIDEDRSGLAIALVGKWGSGKSTVVSIIQCILAKGLPKSGKNNFVFHFDAWAHHGDPMRRALLEKLIHDLDNEGIVSSQNFELDLAKLRGNTVVVHRQIRTSVSVWSFLFGVAAMLIPIGYLFIAPSAWESEFSFSIPWIQQTEYTIDVPVAGILLLSIPFVLAFVAWFAMRPIRAPWKKEFWSCDNFKEKSKRYKNENIFTLLLNKGQKVSHLETTRTQNVTTTEFNRTFDAVVQEIEKEGRRLILIIDNIDRLPLDLALETWATIRNFFSSGVDHERRSILRTVTTILPLSTDSLKRILAKINKIEADKIDFDRLSSDALGKTVDAVFYIPDTVTTDWKSFLYKKLLIVLPILSLDELHSLYSIVEIYFSEERRYPTPRNLVTFVNEVSILHNEWCDEVDLRSIGAYVLHRTLVGSDLEQLSFDSALSNRLKVAMGDTDWQTDFAVLYFHLPKEKARQVRLDGPITNAIENDEVEELVGLLGAEGSAEALTRVLRSKAPTWSSGDPAILISVCSFLSSLDATKEHHWRILSDAAKKMQSWQRFDGNSRSGVEAILENCPNSHLLAVANRIIDSLAALPSPGLSDQDYPGTLATIISEVAASTARRRDASTVVRLLKGGIIPGDAEAYIKFADAASEEMSFEFWHVGHEAEISEIVETLEGRVTDADIPKNFRSILEGVFRKHKDAIDWKPIFDAAATLLHDSMELEPLYIDALLQSLVLLSDRNDSVSTAGAFPQACADGYLLRYFKLNSEDELQRRISCTVASGTFASGRKLSFTQIQNHPALSDIEDGRQAYQKLLNDPAADTLLVELIAKNIINFVTYQEICERAVSDSTSANLSEALAPMIVELGSLFRYNAKWMILNHKSVIDVIDEALKEKLLTFYDERPVFATTLGEIEVTEIDPYFIDDILNSDTKLKNIVADKVRNYLDGLQKGDWEEAIEDEDAYVLEIFRDFVNSGQKFQLDASIKEILYRCFQQLMQGSDHTHREYLAVLVNALPTGTRSSLLKDMATDAARSTSSSAPGLELVLDILGEEIFQSFKSLARESSDILRNVVCRIIQSRYASGGELLLCHSTVIRKLLKKSSDEDRAYFGEVIEEIESGDDTIWQQIRSAFDESST